MQTTNHNFSNEVKPFSQKAITLSAFLTGPLAPTYMVYQNFKMLGKNSEANKAVGFGVFYTVGLFSLIMMLPDEVMDKIPSVAFGGLNALFIGGLVHAQLGAFLNTHKEEGKEFQKMGKSILVSVIGLIAILGVTFGLGYVEVMNDESVVQYELMMSEFDKNENKAMNFYTMLDTANQAAPLIKELNEVSIPLWKDNLVLVETYNNYNAHEVEIVEQNQKIIKYVELRLQALNMIKKGLEEDTDAYAVQIIALHKELAAMLEE